MSRPPGRRLAHLADGGVVVHGSQFLTGERPGRAGTREVSSLASSPVLCACARAMTSQGPGEARGLQDAWHIRGAAATMAALPALF